MAKVEQDLSALEQRTMLAIMRLKSNAYGISIQDCLHQDTGKEYAVGSIYSVLDRLEEKGFVKSRIGDATAERGGKRKQYFLLTGQGEVALDAAMNSWVKLTFNAGWKGKFA